MNDGAAPPAAAAGRLEGLSEQEAARRLARHGPNTLEKPRSRNVADIMRDILREPMFLLLLAAAVLYLTVGDWGEGIFVLCGAAVTIGLVVFQEARTERVVSALRQLAEPFARVIREGRERRIPAHELVPGDLMLAGEGERLPADGVLVAGDALTVDESVLTGESVPVSKRPAGDGGPAEHAEAQPGGEATSFVYAGTMNVRGQGVVEVTRTGVSTNLGRIGLSLASIEDEPTLLQKSMQPLVARLGATALAFCGIVALTYGVLRGDWIEGGLAGITLAIALLPEEFPMVLAIFLALGSFRLARQKVLVRRSAAIETLGAVTMLCVDKTGTLTENRMRVAATWRTGILYDPSAAGALDVLVPAALASAPRPVDPMDKAVREAVGSSPLPVSATQPLRSYPLRPDRLAFIQAWAMPDGEVLHAAKGAPEAIFDLCGMPAGERAPAEGAVAELAERGLRVLGVASSRRAGVGADGRLPLFGFDGLVAFEDPVRSDAAAALSQARHAGIDVAMITGDYPATAVEIARQAGIDTGAGAMTGAEIARLAPGALEQRVRRTRVFARVAPEQKLALVEAFKANGEVVAMTGDGINDAPALEAAHIGIAMGRRGTDVAREAADIVLLDDRLASIIGGIRLGRRIFANLRKALVYVTAIHIPVAGLALLPVVTGLPPVLFPLHVVLLELIIDPVCSLVFEGEPGERHAMDKPPRRSGEALFGMRHMAFGVLQGLVVLACVFGAYLWAWAQGLPEDSARALAFVMLIAGNLSLAFAEAAEVGTPFLDRRHWVFFAIATLSFLVMAAIFGIPALASVFRVSLPPWPVLAAGLLLSAAAGGWVGFARWLGEAAAARRARQA
ncbi:cation-translocating P-type ATPase [Labrys monachus]|uniref:Ca2+-transporting ATPase n=1 Tax=Labrys monachus TaxID=217067 RepID=A0ABU0F8X5_9HYPH|nr:cation-translocating P-type ATPase [Labrys monachus]MDQ0391063.1 Ca2+-transporting ATPase [Labrys monachus]